MADSDSAHRCHFEMIQGGMACACGETITGTPETDTLRRFLKAAESAMREEGITGPLAERVINRLVYGDPLGPTARYKLNEDGTTFSVTMAMNAPLPATAWSGAVREFNERMGRVNGR